jgi:hypothetical protein
MVAIAANHGLKSGCQKPHVLVLHESGTAGADKQVRENPGQPKHPYFEIARGEIDRTTLLKSPHSHSNEAEDRILWLVLRQEPIDQFHHVTRTNCSIVVRKKFHRRIQQLCGLDSHKVPVFLFVKVNSGMCQWLQRRPKAVFHLACPVGDASELAMIAAEKRDYPIGLSKRICLQYNRVALMESHTDKRDLEK